MEKRIGDSDYLQAGPWVAKQVKTRSDLCDS